MKLVFVLVSLCLTSVSFATTAPSAYSTLKELFDKASMPIHENDVDLAAAESNQRCLFVSNKEMEKLFPSNVVRVDVVIPGKPSNGPLFPATQDRAESMILINGSARTGFSMKVWNEIARNIKKSVTLTEITEELTSGSLYKLRKNQNYVVVKATENIGTLDPVVYYGYCYRN